MATIKEYITKITVLRKTLQTSFWFLPHQLQVTLTALLHCTRELIKFTKISMFSWLQSQHIFLLGCSMSSVMYVLHDMQQDSYVQGEFHTQYITRWDAPRFSKYTQSGEVWCQLTPSTALITCQYMPKTTNLCQYAAHFFNDMVHMHNCAWK